MEFGEFGDGGGPGIGRIRTFHKLLVVFQSGTSSITLSILLLRRGSINPGFPDYRTAAASCAPSTRETTITYPCGTGKRTKRDTRSPRPRYTPRTIVTTSLNINRYVAIVSVFGGHGGGRRIPSARAQPNRHLRQGSHQFLDAGRRRHPVQTQRDIRDDP